MLWYAVFKNFCLVIFKNRFFENHFWKLFVLYYIKFFIKKFELYLKYIKKNYNFVKNLNHFIY